MPTQQALYADLAERSFDPELSWAEHELPERLRTKHVHRLHPYLGKFVPQLVERFLTRHFRPGQRILDPFAGSGTTLVECTTFGANSVGVDVSAFNVLLSTVKTGRYDADAVERDLVAVLQAAEGETGAPGGAPAGADLRADVRAEVLHADARCADYGVRLDGLITSPPYPGRIDYHEQHRYAFELLGLDERRAEEIGAPWRGTGRAAIAAYVDDVTAV